MKYDSAMYRGNGQLIITGRQTFGQLFSFYDLTNFYLVIITRRSIVSGGLWIAEVL